jgi:hypothetical protein
LSAETAIHRPANQAACWTAAAQRGGVLILMIVSVLILGAATLVLQAAQQTRRPLEEQRTTEQRMKRIEQAITAYWLTNGCATLPSTPAGLPSGPAPEVPWVALGLQADDRLDAWGRLITYRQAASGLTVSGTAARWALVSHGPSGLGAWLPSGVQKLPLPVVTNIDETANLKATTPFALESKPANAPDGVDSATNTAHFDDTIRFGLKTEWDALCIGSGPPTVDPSTPPITLSLVTLENSGVTFQGFQSNQQTLTIPADGSIPSLILTVQAGKQIAADNTNSNPKIGVGVCDISGNCAAEISGTDETLSIKLVNAKAYKLGVLFENFTLSESALIKFKFNNVEVGTAVIHSGESGASANNLVPTVPSAAFDEVVIGAVGASSFFIEALRFCDANTSCVP